MKIGKNPSTHIWDARSMKVITILKGFHRRGIICVDFSGKLNDPRLLVESFTGFLCCSFTVSPMDSHLAVMYCTRTNQ